MSTWLRYFAFWRRDARLDATDEIAFHLEMRVRDLIARGMTAEEARRQAERDFGDAAAIQAQMERIDTRVIRRDARVEWWHDLRRDVRVAVRSLRSSPAFTVTAVLCAALGIGTTAAIVSAAQAILVRPLPYARSDELVAIYGENTARGFTGSNISWPDYLSWRAENRVFSGIGIWTWNSLTLAGTAGDAARSDAERVNGAMVSSNLFHILGVQPARGRLFVDGEDGANAARVVLLGDDLWKRRFGADSAIVGTSISIDGAPYTVVGIMKPRFNFPARGELWIPFDIDPRNEEHSNRYHAGAIGRIRPGVTFDQARADLHRIDAALEKQFPDMNHGWRADVVPMREDLVGDLREPLKVFLWSVALVLLMVCANVANLMLARGASRSREIAVRSALGASRARLGRQLMTESLVVALLGGVLGAVIAWWGIRLLRFAFPDQTPPFFIELSLNGWTLLMVAVITVLTGVLFGVLPTLRGTRVDLNSDLRDGTRGAGDALRRSRLRSGLVIAEVGLSVMLMIGALLLVRSYRNLSGTDLGFDEKGVLSARISLPEASYPTRAHALEFFERLLERLRQVPGVTVVGSGQGIPFSGWNVQSGSHVQGTPLPARGEELISHFQLVSPDFFKAMGVRLVRGRWLTEADRAAAAPVVLVNETMVARALNGQEPIGRRISVSGPTYATIVGVVSDYRHYRLPEPMGPATYYNYAYRPVHTQTVVLRTTLAEPSSLVPALRAVVREIDPSVATYQVQTFEEAVDRSLWRQRLQGNVLTIFASLALGLACIGLYGVISYAVAQRRRELAVRVALGATRGDVVRLVFGESGVLVAGGVALGLAGAAFGVRILESLLYGVKAVDPTTFATVPLLLAFVALVAALVPARRASSVDPIIAMRSE
ncbi:MAG: ADOP family duplicated permease [Gemmatimonadaceae bacterium]